MKYCNIPVYQNFTFGESEYRCQYRSTVNSKCNLYSVPRVHYLCYCCVFHIRTSETVDCQRNWELIVRLKNIYQGMDQVRKSIFNALRNLVPLVQFKKHEKNPWKNVIFN